MVGNFKISWFNFKSTYDEDYKDTIRKQCFPVKNNNFIIYFHFFNCSRYYKDSLFVIFYFILKK